MPFRVFAASVVVIGVCCGTYEAAYADTMSEDPDNQEPFEEIVVLGLRNA